MHTGNAVARRWMVFVSNRDLWGMSLALVVWLCVLLSAVRQPVVITNVIDPLATAISSILASLLRLLGNDIDRTGAIITSDTLSLKITYKCTAVYQLAAYCAWLLAYRTDILNKAVGLVAGVCVISLANLVRIVAIFYVGVYSPGWIPLVHNMLGEVFMILVVVFTTIGWEKRIARRAEEAHQGTRS